jgi:hypothetical protein
MTRAGTPGQTAFCIQVVPVPQAFMTIISNKFHKIPHLSGVNLTFAARFKNLIIKKNN